MSHCNFTSQFWGITPKAVRAGQTEAVTAFSHVLLGFWVKKCVRSPTHAPVVKTLTSSKK